jgi:hypothetical protein
VFDGSWCPSCARIQRRTEPQQELARVREAAHAKGGICLDQDFPGIGGYYRFRCAQGHEWRGRAKQILGLRSWCRRCASAACAANTRRKDGLQQLQAFAAERGGECLSTEYKGAYYPVRLRCAKGHEWETNASNPLLLGAWCRLCAHASRRLSIKDAQEVAAARGGQCLSPAYVNFHSKLSWMCDRGHVWQATLASIRSRGTWCKQCSSMARISNRNSKARIKYQTAGRGFDTVAAGDAGDAPEVAPAKPGAPAFGISNTVRHQGKLKLTTRSGDTDARTPEEDSSIT